MGSPARSLVLAIDIGSSSLRTALFDTRGKRLDASGASQKYGLHYTPDGGAELKPRELLAAASASLSRTLRARRKQDAIIGVAASAFWHSLLGLNHRGAPITPIFTWADSRSAIDAAELRRELSERQIQLRSGCMLRASYWPAKLRWFRRVNPAVFRRVATWNSPSPWIFRELFGVGVTSHSMASGTGLYNSKTGGWDAELCGLCDVRMEQLGEISSRASESPVIPKGLAGAALFSALGDGAASNLGSGANRVGTVAINIGTSAALRTVLPTTNLSARQFPLGLFRYVVDDERLLLGGALSNGGNLRQWCLRELRFRDEAEAEKALSRRAASTDTLTVLPFWVSERAPSWPEKMRGTITGLTPVTSAADIYRAATTSTYYRLAEILELLESAGHSTAEIIVSGGVLHSSASLPILADCLGRDLLVCTELESSLRGAAVYALQNLGFMPVSLRKGRLVRNNPDFAERHRTRRATQAALERRLL